MTKRYRRLLGPPVAARILMGFMGLVLWFACFGISTAVGAPELLWMCLLVVPAGLVLNAAFRQGLWGNSEGLRLHTVYGVRHVRWADVEEVGIVEDIGIVEVKTVDDCFVLETLSRAGRVGRSAKVLERAKATIEAGSGVSVRMFALSEFLAEPRESTWLEFSFRGFHRVLLSPSTVTLIMLFLFMTTPAWVDAA